MSSVLLVEDDAAIAQPLARALRREGYDVEVVADGVTAVDRSVEGAPDLVILDLTLPRLDGVDVCRRLRERGLAVPVMMLTARSEELDTVIGLDAGADDYVTKPFRLAEVLARVRALLRRQAGPAGGPAEAHDVRVDPRSHQAWQGGKPLELTPKEFELLALLVREAGRVVSKERILQDVWDTHWYGSGKTVDMHVSWLRKKLGDDPRHPRYITTVRGVGLRFETG